jgi:hypothetical protein
MLRRALLLVAFAGIAHGSLDDADDAADAVKKELAYALHAHDAKAAMELFDSRMTNYGAIRTGIEKLIESGEVSLDIDPESGVWKLIVISRDLASGVTRRETKPISRIANGRIESFAPAEFFAAPPRSSEAWDAVYAFAQSLNDEGSAPGMRQFDPAMAGFADLKSAVAALWTRYRIEPALDLKSNEGDDAVRVLEIDWTLTLNNPQDPLDSTRRDQKTTIHVQKQGKAWRIVEFSPASLFGEVKK